MTEQILVSLPAAARSLSVSEMTLRRLTASGDVRCTRLGRRVLYAPSDLHAYAKRCRKESR